MSVHCSLKDRKGKSVCGGVPVGRGQMMASEKKKTRKVEAKSALVAEAGKRGIPVHALVDEQHVQALRFKEMATVAVPAKDSLVGVHHPAPRNTYSDPWD